MIKGIFAHEWLSTVVPPLQRGSIKAVVDNTQKISSGHHARVATTPFGDVTGQERIPPGGRMASLSLRGGSELL